MQTKESKILDRAMKMDHNLKLAATEMLKTEDFQISLLKDIIAYVNPASNHMSYELKEYLDIIVDRENLLIKEVPGQVRIYVYENGIILDRYREVLKYYDEKSEAVLNYFNSSFKAADLSMGIFTTKLDSKISEFLLNSLTYYERLRTKCFDAAVCIALIKHSFSLPLSSLEMRNICANYGYNVDNFPTLFSLPKIVDDFSKFQFLSKF